MATRLYFHALSSGLSNLPTAEQSALTASVNGDAQSVNRKMTTTIGTSQATLTLVASATTSLQTFYFTRFVSDPIYQTSVATNTWTYAFAASATSSSANFPVSGSNQPVYVNCYVWRPSTQTKVGTILDGNTASTVDEGAVGGNTYFHIVTFSGSAVSGVQGGDVICLEIWFQVTQATASGFSDTLRYDGTTVYTENTQTTSAASYLETPETLNFTPTGNSFTRNIATETVTITDSVARSSTHNPSRNLPTETVTVTGVVTRVANKKRTPATETVTISSSVARFKNFIPPVNYVRNLPTEIVSITSSVGIIPNLAISKKYTSDRGYWQPVRPRIKIYALTDSSYSNTLYSYDAFLDTGGIAKPISLSFESTTGNAGVFTLEIEDSTNTLDPNTFSRGNRVVIECSKDGSLYRIAFKGVIRSIDQRVYGQTGKNIILKGYSYLIRLTERVVDFQAQSALDVNGNYIRTDSSMFTNTLLNTILTNDSTYLYTSDDTALYNLFRVNNIGSSSINQWIPRIDAQLATLNDAVGSIVEFSNSLLGINMSNDQLVLYNQDNVTTDSQIFLVTNKVDKDSDSAETTMYPLEPYTYNFGYDNPDSASRLIASIGISQCPAVTTGGLTGMPSEFAAAWTPGGSFFVSGGTGALAQMFRASDTQVFGAAIGMANVGNVSTGANRLTGRIKNITAIGEVGWGPWSTDTWTGYYPGGSQIGSDFFLYRDGVSGTAFPSTTTNNWYVSMDETTIGPTLTLNNQYFLVIVDADHVSTSTDFLRWQYDPTFVYNSATASATGANNVTANSQWVCSSSDGGTNWVILRPYDTGIPSAQHNYDLNEYRYAITTGSPPVTTPPCGGPPNTADAEPNFLVAADMNQINRIGMVEKVITSLPDHIKNQQTMNEYFFAKIYSSSKPKFTFDFPSVTMPNIMPVAGDIVCHVDTLAKIGVAGNPIQTGIISQINYDFKQDDEGVLGLTKLALQTSGIKRGSY